MIVDDLYMIICSYNFSYCSVLWIVYKYVYIYYTCFLCFITGWCCKYMCYIYKYEKLYFPFFSDRMQRHSGCLNNRNDIEICCSMGNVEHVIFSIYDLIIIIYISKTTCILVACVILICTKLDCTLLISTVWHLYQIWWACM